MGAVYLAQDPAIGRLVAIKLLREGLDNPELRERFAREARSAGRLRHPNIVTLFHVGEHESQPYIVMEYIPGDTLADIVKQRLPLTVRHKLRIIEDLCRGLAHAHKSGVVHRDIKPANILVDSEGIVKILDFGIARIGEQEMTRLGMMMGTPNYMSPEQINPGTADYRSDVFSVGLVFYELLAYRRAFPGDSFAVLRNIVDNEPEPIEALVPDLDPEVVAILRRALQKNPDNRYQDIGSMRVDLARVRGRLRSSSADDGSDEGPLTPIADTGPNTDSPTVVALPVTQISQHLGLARQAFEAKQFERALTESHQALALEPGNVEAAEIGRRAQHEIDLAAAAHLLNGARSALADGHLSGASEALNKAESLGLTRAAAPAVLDEITALRHQVEAARQAVLRARAAVTLGRSQLNAGNVDAARRSVDDARAAAPDDEDVKALQAAVASAVAERDRKAAEEQRERDRAAFELQHREQAARELQQREQAARELQQRELAARELQQREQAARELQQREQAARELQQREQAARELQQRELAARELKQREQAARELQQREEAARALKQREQAAQEQGKLDEAAKKALAAPVSAETVVLKRQSPPTAPPTKTSTPRSTKESPRVSAASVPSNPRLDKAPTPPTTAGRSGSALGKPKPAWAIPAAAGVLIAIVLGAVAIMLRSGGDGNSAHLNSVPPAATTIPAAPATSTLPPTVSSAETTPTTVPTTTPAEDPQVAALHSEVTGILSRGDAGRAVQLLAEAPTRLQRDPAIERDIEETLTAARNAAARAQRRVSKANTSSSEYRQGVQLQTQAGVLVVDSRRLDAATTYLQAGQFFTRALTATQTAAASSSTPPSIATTTTSVAPVAAAPPVQVPATTSVPAAVPISPPPTNSTGPQPTGPTPAQDTAAIQAVLQQYVDGYKALNLAAIRKAFPNANANFRDAKAYEIELTGVHIELQGSRATVTCQRSVRQINRSGKPNANVFPTTFILRRDPAGWIIEDVR
jgi:chemotaxis protein histidine kinase CheA